MPYAGAPGVVDPRRAFGEWWTLAQERLAVADEDEMDREIGHVDQALLQQGLAEETVTWNEEIAAVLLLELRT